MRHGLSKALMRHEPDLRGVLKRGGFLTRDSPRGRAQEVRPRQGPQKLPVLEALSRRDRISVQTPHFVRRLFCPYWLRSGQSQPRPLSAVQCRRYQAGHADCRAIAAAAPAATAPSRSCSPGREQPRPDVEDIWMGHLPHRGGDQRARDRNRLQLRRGRQPQQDMCRAYVIAERDSCASCREATMDIMPVQLGPMDLRQARGVQQLAQRNLAVEIAMV